MKNKKVRAGDKFSYWTVIKRAAKRPNYWRCKCRCGKVGNVYVYGLVDGLSKSCGCSRNEPRPYKAKDVSGKRFGHLVAIRDVGADRFKSRVWECLCDCGKSHMVPTFKLNNGDTKSCGCERYTGISLQRGQSAFNRVYSRYRRGAAERSVRFDISKERFRQISQQDCAYCGQPPLKEYHIGRATLNGSYFGNGIDRMDNANGYVEGNCAPCCEICNRAKRAMSMVEFKEWAYRLAGHLSKWGQ